jgi:hypothetical protein
LLTQNSPARWGAAELSAPTTAHRQKHHQLETSSEADVGAGMRPHQAPASGNEISADGGEKSPTVAVSATTIYSWKGTMLRMRRFGFTIMVAAIVGLTACRCNKSAGPQPAPSTQLAGVAAPLSSSSASVGVAGAASVGPAADAGGADTSIVVPIGALDFAPVKGSKYLPMKLTADGLISRQGKPFAKIASDKLADDDGSPVASFEPPATIAIEGSKVRFKFNDKDELEGPDGGRIAISDLGVPTILTKANAKPEALTGKFIDFDPKLRRAAAIVLAIKEIKKAAKDAKPHDPAQKKDKKKGKKKKKSQ